MQQYVNWRYASFPSGACAGNAGRFTVRKYISPSDHIDRLQRESPIPTDEGKVPDKIQHPLLVKILYRMDRRLLL